ncbi:VOC family protein [Mycobacterium malmoense]|uniref:VOC family protein n=1 Tax=Mycobacterium malmoense TaxID=1780 RepID=UPI001586E2C0|nr:VOC family protein [Mycobacterium malmoense]
MTGPALKPADFYHTGIIVPDIAAAAARLSVVSGYEWTKPVEATLSVTTEGGVYEVPFEFVYSLQAPHLELVTEVPGTVWTASPGTATHHLGYWADDLATTARDLEKAGFRQEARPSGDILNSFAYYTDNTGLRIEIVDRAMFPDWPGFLEAMRA